MKKSPQLRLEHNPLYPAPLQESLVHSNSALLEMYQKTWTENIGEITYSERGDLEHFVETMSRFHSALTAFGKENTYFIDVTSPSRDTIINKKSHDFIFGPILRSQEEVITSASRYWTIPAFSELSGRSSALAGFYVEEEDGLDLLQTVQDMYSKGIKRFVFKGVKIKSFVEISDTLTSKPKSYFDKESGLDGDFIMNVIHLEGRPQTILVQEYIPMENEYRFFMAGDSPATGAGCIKSMTPLDSHGALFDARTEVKRGSGIITKDYRVLGKMIAFAKSAGKVLYSQAPDLGEAWVLDCAKNADTGEIVMIEANSARNSGLYASDPLAWMKAVRQWIVEH